MGKKSKRSRKGGNSGGNSGGNNGGNNGGNGGEEDTIMTKTMMTTSGHVTDESTGAEGKTTPRKRGNEIIEEEEEEENIEENKNNLRYEDPYEDMYEEEDDVEYEDVYESSGDEGEDDECLPAINDDDDRANSSTVKIQSWNPFKGNKRQGGGQLEMDETAYKMHHAITPEWPSLSIDILPDALLGDNRTRFPHVATFVAGSQADERGANKLTVMRASDLGRVPGSGREKTEKELDDEMLGEEWRHEDEEDDDEEDSDSEDEEEEVDPILEHYAFPHSSGGINRVRCCPQDPSIVACWSDAGLVSLYDIAGALDVLDRSQKGSLKGPQKNSDNKTTNNPPRNMRKDPFFVYSGHSTEGYAIDWSRVTPARLATADCNGNIHIWDPTHPVVPYNVDKNNNSHNRLSAWNDSSFRVKPTYSAHGDNIDNPSVEDIQWSPNEATVMATAECGGYVRIYDIRCPDKAMISNKIHDSGADVNVIAWNRVVTNLLASGGDDGSFSVWDLRNFQTTNSSASPKPLARFHSHQTPITSLQWHPTDESMITVSDDHGTYVYDLSIEEDDPENKNTNDMEKQSDIDGIPPQLLFVHSGSEMTKEAHWHPQIASCLVTTSLNGFSLFIPSNL